MDSASLVLKLDQDGTRKSFRVQITLEDSDDAGYTLGIYLGSAITSFFPRPCMVLASALCSVGDRREPSVLLAAVDEAERALFAAATECVRCWDEYDEQELGQKK